MIRGIVWYKNRNNGEEQFNIILSRYKIMGIPQIKIQKDKTTIFITLENGDKWWLIKADGQRKIGRCNISYIDRSINNEIIEKIIKPCTILWPYTAYNYY